MTGAGVMKGVGGEVGGCVSGKAVVGTVVQPLPEVMQQYCCCSADHRFCQFMKPASQSNGSDVVPMMESNQSNRGRRSKRLRRQHPVIIQVKSLLGRTTSKSPPWPTYW